MAKQLKLRITSANELGYCDGCDFLNHSYDVYHYDQNPSCCLGFAERNMEGRISPGLKCLGPGVYQLKRVDKKNPEIKSSELFEILTECWKRDSTIKLSSDPMAVMNNPAYKTIVAFGRDMAHHIFRDYQKNGGRWEVALAYIFKVRPVKPEHRGMADKIREDWLEWGRKNGYLK